ncbi:hypothetical protein [Aromatoleum petrolei]|uniref:Uncharacterized protein n=1 Tax=Aromatoleum petrolei TaxID=76116 RepID=A0ABX1MMQ3_9RHOO|nr:hypothetical protein [Aromatoleum petrolei]NMF87626.1 hypothetical protein [Aromatoleum petrolei]QTQ38727.1 Uncharacterized protein ToN1_46320 [Aromatoleum petrolei]
MKPPRRSPNHELTRNEYALTSANRGVGRMAFVLGATLVVAVLVAVAGLRFFENNLAPASYLSDVRAENIELRKELAKVRLELDVELATRGELERQVAALNEQLKQVGDELAFLKSAGAGKPEK